MQTLLLLFVVTTGLLLGCGHGQARDASQAEREPGESALLLERARAFAQNQDYTRAEQYLSLAAQSGTPDGKITPMLIDVCVKDQRYRAALQYAQEYLRRHPRAYRLRFVQASLLAALGDVARAREELERVLATKPTHADAHYSLAILLRDDLGNRLEADLHFRRYLQLAPDGAHAEEAGESLLEAMP